MTAIGYIRVSTEDQAREGISLDLQVSKIRDYCRLNELGLAGIYGDPGVSGKSADVRPGLQAILYLVRQRRIAHVVVYKLDRLARNTIECLEMAEEMAGLDVALHSITEKLDTKSAIGRFFFTLMASLAEMERHLIGERTLAALARKRENGGRVGRYARLGYRLDGDQVEPDPIERRAICRALDLRGDGLTYREISTVLFEEGCRSRNGNRYSPSVIGKMLRGGANGISPSE